MNWNTFLPTLIVAIITATITIIGWFYAHKLSRRRDQENKRKELRIKYLIEAWKKLEFASNRKEKFDKVEFIERPLAEI